MTQRPLGYCLIINNYNFEKKSKFSNREGTWKDKDDLFSLFHRMHFKVEVRDDLEASDIRDAIKEFANKDHAQMGAFVCCVLSHGEKGTVLGVDGKPVEIRELTQPFAECRTLASKPKLFFIQACQGKVAQDGVWTADGQVNNTEEGTFEEDAYNPALRMVPIEADFLIGMATVEYYQSFRHTRKGSIYIQELCRQLEICRGNDDILSILTKVNREVSTRVLKGYKQMPEPRYTLTKKLVLPMD
ncbi:caspase-8-like [Rhinichthys klamathensis goyatoka]|uniref:caspase-8-like n=1 Tax=Rhinichthys klamathensis goyatoka TaxID=3034132 RepID=UPI0024B51146|nr:caspase-8-like [Rhinichthys klamathensis goyatoka]